MTLPADPAAPRLAPPWALVLAWLAAFAWLATWSLSARFDPDEFIFVSNARRVAAGQVPSRDFFEFIMPGWLLLTGGVFKLVGPSLYAARLVAAAFAAAGAVLYGRLAYAVTGSRGLAVMLGLMVVTLLPALGFFFNHRWFAIGLAPLPLLLAWRALGRPDARAWGLAGLGVGAVYAMHQQDGAVLGLGLGLGLIWLSWWERAAAATTLERLGWLVGGALAPVALLALYFLVHGALGEFLWQTHVWPLQQYRAAGNHNDVGWLADLSLAVLADPWVSRAFYFARTPQEVVIAFGPVLAALAGLVWLVGLGRGDGASPGRARAAFTGLVVFVAALAFVMALRARPDASHLRSALMPALLLATLAIAAWERVLTAPGQAGARWLPRLAFGALLASGPLMLLELARWDPGRRPALALPDARIQAHPTIAALRSRLAPGDTVLPGPRGEFYAFYVAPNPTRFDYWVPGRDGYLTAAQHDQLMAEVAAAKPRYLLVPALERRLADRVARDFTADYAFTETLPHVTDDFRPRRWLSPYEVYLYERRDAPRLR